MWKTMKLFALIIGALFILFGNQVQAREGDKSTSSFDDPWNVTIGPHTQENWNYLNKRGMEVAHFEEGHALHDKSEYRARMILGPTEKELTEAYATSTPVRNFIGTETEGPGGYRLNPVLGEYGPMLPVR